MGCTDNNDTELEILIVPCSEVPKQIGHLGFDYTLDDTFTF